MEIVVHYPADEHKLNTLYEKVAILHGEYVYSYLKKQNLSQEEKLAIIKGIEGILR